MLSNDTPYNALISYAYSGRNKALTNLCAKDAEQGKINLMIDSGAFTIHNAHTKSKHLNLQNYCEYLQEMQNYCEKYVMLDVIGNAEKTRRNYEYMISLGLKPMYVVTIYDNDFRFINSTLDVCPHICVAGGATAKNDWLAQRFQIINEKTQNRSKIHGLAYVTFPRMLQLKLESVDSSTWKAAPQRFGYFNYFDKGIKNISRKEIIEKNKIEDKKLIYELEKIKVTPKMVADYDLCKSAMGIMQLLSLKANIRMQEYCYRRGLRYFLAIPDTTSMITYQYVRDNIDTITFDEYRKIQTCGRR